MTHPNKPAIHYADCPDCGQRHWRIDSTDAASRCIACEVAHELRSAATPAARAEQLGDAGDDQARQASDR